MRTIEAGRLEEVVRQLYMDVNVELRDGVRETLQDALQKEESEIGKEVLEQLIENVDIARRERIPACQDTGVAVVYLQIGQDVRITGDLKKAVNNGVARGCKDGYLRASVVRDPLQRVNTGDNTPAVLHIEMVPSDTFRVLVMAKGTGAENMSQLKMMTPAEGVAGVKDFVLQVVREAGSNACPPVTVGVGIGGTFDSVGWLAKKALIRTPGTRHPDEFYAKLERELLDKINRTGIGPEGLGGRVTAFDVRIETHPCHIGALPVAVNMECYAHRVKEASL